MNGPAMTDARLDTVLAAYDAPAPSAGFAARIAAEAARPGRASIVDRRAWRRPWARRGIIGGVLLANLLAVGAIAAVLHGHPFALTRIASIAHQLFARPAATRVLHHPVHAVAAHRVPAAAVAAPPAERPGLLAQGLAAPAVPMPPRAVATIPVAPRGRVATMIHPLSHPIVAHAHPEHRFAPRVARERLAERRHEQHVPQLPREHADHERLATPAMPSPRAAEELDRPAKVARSESAHDGTRDRPEGAAPYDMRQQRAAWRERRAAWRGEQAQRGDLAQGAAVDRAGNAAGRGTAEQGERAGSADRTAAASPAPGAHEADQPQPGMRQAGMRQPGMRQRQPGFGQRQSGAGQRRAGGGWRRFGGRGGRRK